MDVFLIHLGDWMLKGTKTLAFCKVRLLKVFYPLNKQFFIWQAPMSVIIWKSNQYVAIFEIH